MATVKSVLWLRSVPVLLLDLSVTIICIYIQQFFSTKIILDGSKCKAIHYFKTCAEGKMMPSENIEKFIKEVIQKSLCFR